MQNGKNQECDQDSELNICLEIKSKLSDLESMFCSNANALELVAELRTIRLSLDHLKCAILKNQFAPALQMAVDQGSKLEAEKMIEDLSEALEKSSK